MRDAGRTGVAVGFFDGVHVAHRELLSQAAAAFTFRNHPLTVLAPDRAPSLILSAADRLARLSGCGLDEVVAVDFTRELADTAPEEFAASLLVLAAKFTPVGVPRVLCGPNWRFGRGGVGDAALLRRLGAEVVEVPFVEYTDPSNVPQSKRSFPTVICPSKSLGCHLVGSRPISSLSFSGKNSTQRNGSEF